MIALSNANPHVASNRFTLTGSATTEDKLLFMYACTACNMLMQSEYLFTDSGTFSTHDVIHSIHAKDIKRLWILKQKYHKRLHCCL